MISLKLCRNILIRFFIVLVIISTLLSPQAFCQETEDSQIFISGFNAYQQKDYSTAIEKMNEVLQKYPDTPLRDMALFWLSRSYFKSGNQQSAARFMSQFSKEYPDNPLKGTIEEELLSLLTRYEKGETLPSGSQPSKAAEKQPSQKAKADMERLARQKAEQERLAQEQAEKARSVKEQADKERLSAEQQELERVAAEKVAMERLAQEKAAREKSAAEQAQQERQAREQADNERLAAEKQEQERIVAEKAAMERLAKEKATQEKRAAEQADLQRQPGLKTGEERKLSEKAEQERISAERAELERLAQEKAALEKIAAEKAEQERQTTAKAGEGRKAAESAGAEGKSGGAVIAAAQPEAKPKAEPTAEQQRLAQQEIERVAAEKTEQQRLSALKAEEERLAAEQAAEKRLAAEKAKQEEIAAAKAEEERRAAAAEAARLAAAKQEQERMASEKAAAEAEAARQTVARQEQERLAAVQAEEQRLARQREAEEKNRSEKAALREKAIAQYKSIIEKYPGSKAASAAATKLQGLGIAVALPPQTSAAPQKGEEQPENAQVLRLEVAQYAGFEFNLLAKPQAYDVARRISIPFELTNRGNGNDSFYLESGFPAEFNASFASAATPEQAINQTPVLPPGGSFKGFVTMAIPASSIDGLRITYPVKAASRFMSEASQSREVAMVAAAPLLRAVLKTDKTQPLPGEKVSYRIALLNVGSTAAQDITFRLNFPPQLEPVDYATAGFKQEMKAALLLEGLQLKSGESKEYSVTFQLKDDSLAGQELLTRVELVNNPLKSAATFVSNVARVQPQHGIMVRAGSDRIVAIPGQIITMPFVVTNTGNIREKFKIASVVKGAQEAQIFLDLNRDGVRQATETAITEVGPLEPKEEASIIMEIKTPRNASDGTEGTVQVSFNSEGDAARGATASASLVYSRPVLQMAMAGRDGRLRPGEIASFDLNITNRGSNIARVVELHSAWPEQLELVAAEPVNSSVTGGNILWKFSELGAGEKRTIKVSFRVRQGTGVGTNIQVKNVLKYEDQLGNRY